MHRNKVTAAKDMVTTAQNNLSTLKTAAKNWRFDLFIFVIQAIKDIKSRL